MIALSVSYQNKNAYRFFSAFLLKGQVIETFRGAGIHRLAADVAVELLRKGAWVRALLFSVQAVLRRKCARRETVAGYLEAMTRRKPVTVSDGEA